MGLARLERVNLHNRSELESRASSPSASGSDQDTVWVIDLDGCRRCICVTCGIQACVGLNDHPARKDVLSIKSERLEAKDVVIASDMAPNTFSRRSQSRGCTGGGLDHGAPRHEHWHVREGS